MIYTACLSSAVKSARSQRGGKKRLRAEAARARWKIMRPRCAVAARPQRGFSTALARPERGGVFSHRAGSAPISPRYWGRQFHTVLHKIVRWKLTVESKNHEYTIDWPQSVEVSISHVSTTVSPDTWSLIKEFVTLTSRSGDRLSEK